MILTVKLQKFIVFTVKCVVLQLNAIYFIVKFNSCAPLLPVNATVNVRRFYNGVHFAGVTVNCILIVIQFCFTRGHNMVINVNNIILS